MTHDDFLDDLIEVVATICTGIAEGYAEEQDEGAKFEASCWTRGLLAAIGGYNFFHSRGMAGESSFQGLAESGEALLRAYAERTGRPVL